MSELPLMMSSDFEFSTYVTAICENGISLFEEIIT